MIDYSQFLTSKLFKRREMLRERKKKIKILQSALHLTVRTKFQSEDFGSLEALELPNRALERNFGSEASEACDSVSLIAVFVRRGKQKQERQKW